MLVALWSVAVAAPSELDARTQAELDGVRVSAVAAWHARTPPKVDHQVILELTVRGFGRMLDPMAISLGPESEVLDYACRDGKDAWRDCFDGGSTQRLRLRVEAKNRDLLPVSWYGRDFGEYWVRASRPPEIPEPDPVAEAEALAATADSVEFVGAWELDYEGAPLPATRVVAAAIRFKGVPARWRGSELTEAAGLESDTPWRLRAVACTEDDLPLETCDPLPAQGTAQLLLNVGWSQETVQIARADEPITEPQPIESDGPDLAPALEPALPTEQPPAALQDVRIWTLVDGPWAGKQVLEFRTDDPGVLLESAEASVTLVTEAGERWDDEQVEWWECVGVDTRVQCDSEAVEAIRQIWSIDTADPVFVGFNDLQVGGALEPLSEGPAPSAALTAEMLIATGNGAEALAWLDQVASDDPGPDTRLQRGIALHLSGALKEAEAELLEAAIAGVPGADLALSDLMSTQKEVSLAALAAVRARLLEPDDTTSFSRLQPWLATPVTWHNGAPGRGPLAVVTPKRVSDPDAKELREQVEVLIHAWSEARLRAVRMPQLQADPWTHSLSSVMTEIVQADLVEAAAWLVVARPGRWPPTWNNRVSRVRRLAEASQQR